MIVEILLLGSIRISADGTNDTNLEEEKPYKKLSRFTTFVSHPSVSYHLYLRLG